MQIQIIQNGRVLQTITHEGQAYVKVPGEGEYTLRLRNQGPVRRLAVVSVDGINVINGEDAGHDGSGYLVNPWGAVDIPGWRRDDNTVAAFSFTDQEESYADQTGRGTSNVGVIGLAVFDEKPSVKVPFIPETAWSFQYESHSGPTLKGGGDMNILRSMSLGGKEPQARSMSSNSSVPVSACGPATADDCAQSTVADVGTGYGGETTFHTKTYNFERATETPVEVVVLRYATRERLKSWGVPVDAPMAPTPNPFPMSSGVSCPAPAGWEG